MRMDAVVAWESYMEGSKCSNGLQADSRAIGDHLKDEELPRAEKWMPVDGIGDVGRHGLIMPAGELEDGMGSCLGAN
jgi:hypothetical protein